MTTSSQNNNQTASPGRLPDFIGVGPPRTATTWLHEVLSGHVGLPLGVKETEFFTYRYSRGIAWYASLFRHCRPDLPIGEFDPSCFVSADARERIFRHISNCRIICTFRDPVERLYSHYRKAFEGQYVQGSFEECLDKRCDLLAWSRYATYLRTWQRLFGRERVLVLLQDDLKRDPQAFLNSVCEFIGIPNVESAGAERGAKMVNAIPARPRSRRLAWAARKLRDGLQDRGHFRLVNALRHERLRKFLFSGSTEFEPLRPETAARLREIFRPEVEDLEEILRRDLSHWKNGARSTSA